MTKEEAEMTMLAGKPAAGQRRANSRDYISFSAIASYQGCSLRYYFHYVLGLPEETVSSALVLGSAIHSCLQFHFEELLAGNQAPNLDILLDVFQDSWKRHASRKVTYARGEDFDSTCRLAENMLRSFLASSHSHPRGTIIGVEEELRGELIPGIPDLLARVDLLVDEGDALVVTDFKTARTSWSQEHVEDSASQLLMYHELTKALSDGRPIKLRFGVLTKTKQPELTLYPVEVSHQRVERTKRIVERAWRAIQSGHFLPNPSPLHCPTCPFRERCTKGEW
jgi:putative RecB family exonuclease